MAFTWGSFHYSIYSILLNIAVTFYLIVFALNIFESIVFNGDLAAAYLMSTVLVWCVCVFMFGDEVAARPVLLYTVNHFVRHLQKVLFKLSWFD